MIDDKLEIKSQLFRRFTAQYHTFKEDFKVIHNGADACIYIYLQNYYFFIAVKLKIRFSCGIVYSVMDIL